MIAWPSPEADQVNFDRSRYVPPYTIVAANGRAIAGHIDNLAAATLIRDRLNGGAG